MSLRLYKKKRNFAGTPEPRVRPIVKKEGFSFCVQKHAATRLHYDFRLELDGVLKSWAVTKGPSIDAADKRLAVRTEDHPLDYRDFEGVIPKGQYGGGTVMLWDSGTWAPSGDPRKGLRKGHLDFELHGHRLRGKWTLVRMGKPDEKRENWLLIKNRDKESAMGEKAETFLDNNASSVKTGYSMEKIASMTSSQLNDKKQQAGLAKLLQMYKQVQLATLVTEPPCGGEWIHEVKFDGYRILCFVANGQIVIRTRNGHDWTERFPSVAEALARLKVKSTVLDGEAVLLNDKGISAFQALQEALSEGTGLADIQAYFFDILHLDGKNLEKKHLSERKEILKRLLKGVKSPLHYSEHLDYSRNIIQQACNIGLEGIVSKKKSAPYFEGRSRNWLKSRCGKRQEFIIIGFTASKSGPRAIGALHIAYMNEGILAYGGKVGTGFDRKFADKLYKMLEQSAIKSAPVKGIPAPARKNSVWVEPQFICEVSFTEWTKDGHVRHPSFEGLRDDKTPDEITMDIPKKLEKIIAGGNEETKVEGITITHASRLLFDDISVTKGELAEYYAFVAPYMLPQIKGRPISLLRCPSGVNAGCFFQRNPDAYMKKIVKAFSWKHHGKSHEYFYIEDVKGLVFLIQMGGIEIHPWGATVDRIDYPRQMIFDLDPDESIPFEAVKLAALDMRSRLKKLRLESFVKCTGGKGLHITVPLDGSQQWPDVKKFAGGFATGMENDVPDAYVATMSKAKRRGKIFIDYFRNDYTATAIADYSVRARSGAPVAVPLEWNELKNLKSSHEFGIKDVMRRLKKKEPRKGPYAIGQILPEQYG